MALNPTKVPQMTDLSRELYDCDKPIPMKVPAMDSKVQIMTQCKKCEQCKKRIKKQWASRLIAESMMHKETAFVTLTYAPEHLPKTITEGYSQIKLWLMTLRNRPFEELKYVDGQTIRATLPKKFRYFVAGEFGPLKDRLHWHCVLFGMPAFPKGKCLSSTWKHGFVTWESVNVSRMTYAACYSTKKTDDHLNFFRCSLKPGLGATYWQKVGALAYHRGQSPLDIKSLQIGKSHFPLDTYSRLKLFNGYNDAALDSNDMDAVHKICSDSLDWIQDSQTRYTCHNELHQINVTNGETSWQ